MDIPILDNIISNEYLNINTLSPINKTSPINTPLTSPTSSTPTSPTPINPTSPTPINTTPINTALPTNNDGKSIYVVFHMFISILAFYLALRCNAKINYTSIIIALFLPYPYVIYSIIMYNGICKIEV